LGKPKNIRELDVELLKQLWSEDDLTIAEIAAEVGVSASWLGKHKEFLGLPKRAPKKSIPQPDPTPEQIAKLAAERRQIHYDYHRENGHPNPQPGRIASQGCIADPTFFKSFCDGVL
jgi:hypothetical protein